MTGWPAWKTRTGKSATDTDDGIASWKEQQDTGETAVGGDTDETATGVDWTVTGVTLDERDEKAPASEDSAISLSSREASERACDLD